VGLELFTSGEPRGQVDVARRPRAVQMVRVTMWLQDLLGAGVAASALVLLVAGLSKVRDRQTFGHQIAAYQILPERASMVLGQFLPVAEMMAGIALLVVPRVGGAAAALLFTVFTLAVAINVMRGRTELVCACFGSRGRQTISVWHVVADAVLAVVGVTVFVSGVGTSLAGAVLGVSLLLAVAVTQAVHAAWLSRHASTSVKEA
jgi:hypothetical protein